MRKKLIGLAVLLAGCTQLMAPSVPQAAIAPVQSTLVPPSIPMVQFVTPEQHGMHYFAPDNSGQWVFTSQAELTTFLQGQPRSTPVPLGTMPPNYPGEWPPPSPTPPELPAAYFSADFSKYQAIAFVSEPAKARSARIVGIEEQADRLLVHTVQWLGADNVKALLPEERHVHIVLVPRTSKQVTFAATLKKTLVAQILMPSPQVGVPGPILTSGDPDPDEHPRWKAVPNPEVTRESIEAQVNATLRGASATISIEKMAMDQVESRHGLDAFSLHYLPESEVYVVVIKGEGAERAFPGLGPGRVNEVIQVRSVEDGMVMTSTAR